MQGVLLIHGFGGSRKELVPLYDFIKDDGFLIELPVLSGHEKTLGEFSKSKYKDWIESAEQSLKILMERCDDVTVVGFSMGGLIATQLYLKYKFNRLCLVNTPVYYFNPKRIAHNLHTDFKKYSTHYKRAWFSRPLSTLFQFQRLLSKTKPMFKKIDGNTLVIQVQDDDTVNASSGDYIYKRLKGKKKILKPQQGGHIIFKSECAKDLSAEIEKFIKENRG